MPTQPRTSRVRLIVFYAGVFVSYLSLGLLLVTLMVSPCLFFAWSAANFSAGPLIFLALTSWVASAFIGWFLFWLCKQHWITLFHSVLSRWYQFLFNKNFMPTNNSTARRPEVWSPKFLEGKWRWAAFLAIYFSSGASGLFLPWVFGAPCAYPDSDPPWYFIRQDFFQGVGHLVGMSAMLVILAATWRRYTVTNWILAAMLALWMVPGIVTGIVIYWRCADFFDYGHAVSAWATFDAYSRSGIKFVGIPVGFGLAWLAGRPALRRFRERQDLT